MLTETQVQAYLRRIGYDGALDRSVDTLRALQRAHVFAVPFENLDIHLGRPMPVDVGHAYDKVVTHHRGGYCYELNPLFQALLSALGHDATVAAGQILLREERQSFDHVATIVHLEEDWLVDVGYGRQPPLMPIGGHDGQEFSNENGVFAIQHRDGGYVVMVSADGAYQDLYSFDTTPRTLWEFEPRSQWVQTSPRSVFTKAPLCTLPVDDGRVTISGLSFIESVGGTTDVREITAEERGEILRAVFGIDLGDAIISDGADFIWVPGT